MSRNSCLVSLLSILFLVSTALASAPASDDGEWYALESGAPGAEATLDAVKPIDDGMSLAVTVPGFHVKTLWTKAGPRGSLEIPGGGVFNLLGSPRLPVLRYMVETPPGATVHLDLSASSWRRLSLQDLGIGVPLIPVQHPVPKIEGAEKTIPFVEDAAVYGSDAFLPTDAVVLADRSVIRGRHVSLVEIRPVRYNAVKGQIEVCSRATVNVTFEGGLPEAGRRDKLRLASRFFDSLLDEEIVSLPSAEGKSETRGMAGGAAEGAAGMVVICHDDFAAAVAPFLDWKRKSGYKVDLVLTSELGASPTDVDVKNAIQSRYDTWSDPPLEFILIVGDTDFTPIHTGSGGGNSQVTDNWYACLDGTDYLPEVAVARISTRSEGETTAVVDKLLLYERATFHGDGWIKMAGFIGTEDSSHISLIEGTHDYCIDNFFTPNGYLPTAWSHGGASCDRHYNSYSATTQDMSDSIDEGRSWINYSGHGGNTGWSGPVSGQGYDQSDVRANINDEMYPVVISNACVTGTLATTECFAETWVKEPNKGAIAFWGASNNSYWDEDDVLQRDLYENIFPMDDTPPLGVILNMTKIDLYNHYGDVGNVAYYFDMYNLVSEPSLSMWTRAPRDLELTYDDAHPIGESNFTVSVAYGGLPVEGAMVGVRKGDEGVFEAGYTDAAGEITLVMDPAPVSVGALEVTVTGHDFRPHEGTCNVISPDTPWLIHRGHVVDDAAGGDGDGQANPGEDFIMPVTVENVGEQPGTTLAATLSTSTPAWCQILDAAATFPDLAAHAQGDSQPDHYAVRVLPGAPDGVMLGFDLAWTADGGASGTTSFKEMVRTVDFAYVQHEVDDASGNNNGVAGPGETVDLVVTVESVGHRDASGISGTLTTDSPWITILQDSSGFPDLTTGSQGDSQTPYSFEVAAGAPDQQPVTFDLILTETGSGYGEVVQFDVMISSCSSIASTDVPHPINDNQTIESTLLIPHAINIGDINVFVDISHTYQGDLHVTLESPLGTQVVLHAGSGGSADNILTWYDTETAPAESLDILNDTSSYGTWKLIVYDDAGGDQGTLNGWALEICGEGIEPVARLSFEGWSMDDVGTCDPDGHADVGEVVIYNVTVTNDGWGPASGVTATLSSSSRAAAVNGPVPMPDLAVGESIVAPIEVLIGAVGCSEQADFTVEMTCTDGQWFDTFSDRLEWDEIDTQVAEDVEEAGAEPAGWTHTATTGTDTWAVGNDRNHTTDGAWSWSTSVGATVLDSWLVGVDYTIPSTPTMEANLEFWHYVSLDSGTDGACLEVSTDGGSSWNNVGSAITEGGYNGTFTNMTHSMYGESIWTGSSSWQRTTVDLAAWRGQTIKFRWHVGSGFFGTGTGWWIDDVVVRTHDEPCDAHACGIPGEVTITNVSKGTGDVVLEWWEDPLCVDFRVWRSSDPAVAGGFIDVTGEDPDSTDCFFHDLSSGDLIYWIIEGIGPDGDGPWGHYGQ